MKSIRKILLLALLIGTSSIAGAQIEKISELPPIDSDTIRVFIVRHAETYHQIQKLDHNSELYYKITPDGVKQSKAVGKALQNQPIVACYSSVTDRTKKTLQHTGLPALKELKVVQKKAFNRPKSGMTEEGKPSSFSWRIEQWKKNRDPQPKGGESLDQAIKRSKKFIKKLKYAYGKAIIVVSHGDIIAGMVGDAKGIPVWDHWEKFAAASSSICVVDIHKSKPAIFRAFNIKVWEK